MGLARECSRVKAPGQCRRASQTAAPWAMNLVFETHQVSLSAVTVRLPHPKREAPLQVCWRNIPIPVNCTKVFPHCFVNDRIQSILSYTTFSYTFNCRKLAPVFQSKSWNKFGRRNNGYIFLKSPMAAFSISRFGLNCLLFDNEFVLLSRYRRRCFRRSLSTSHAVQPCNLLMQGLNSLKT